MPKSRLSSCGKVCYDRMSGGKAQAKRPVFARKAARRSYAERSLGSSTERTDLIYFDRRGGGLPSDAPAERRSGEMLRQCGAVHRDAVRDLGLVHEGVRPGAADRLFNGSGGGAGAASAADRRGDADLPRPGRAAAARAAVRDGVLERRVHGDPAAAGSAGRGGRILLRGVSGGIQHGDVDLRRAADERRPEGAVRQKAGREPRDHRGGAGAAAVFAADRGA